MPATTGITQLIQDGKVVDTTASGNSESTSKKSNTSLDKEAFLQLLVAQMKYQDPLEPTSNTEYISQLATFSSLEEMQNLNTTMTGVQGSSLVGKQVIMRVTSPVTGITTEVQGRVEYTVQENGKTYLSIDGSLYSIDDLVSVVDDEYLSAVELAESFKQAVDSLPSKKDLTLANKADVEAVRKAVNNMTAYQQGFLDKDALDKLQQLVERLAELEANKEDTESAEDAGEETAAE